MAPGRRSPGMAGGRIRLRGLRAPGARPDMALRLAGASVPDRLRLTPHPAPRSLAPGIRYQLRGSGERPSTKLPRQVRRKSRACRARRQPLRAARRITHGTRRGSVRRIRRRASGVPTGHSPLARRRPSGADRARGRILRCQGQALPDGPYQAPRSRRPRSRMPPKARVMLLAVGYIRTLHRAGRRSRAWRVATSASAPSAKPLGRRRGSVTR